MIVRSSYSYAETLSILRRAIVEGGNTIFADIDQSAAASKVGLTLRPTMLLVFGNPKGGTPLMDAFPAFGLELPLKVLVWEEQDGVRVAYTPLKDSAARHSVTGVDDRIERMDAAIDALVRNVATTK
ncbi:MAG TPA: DUF302 domain-containing protein [Candidatus Cybelea sp.]|nr:DUF302 domain-containing protein [Candidatus Cybelea sp.]